jgi:tetratricopeptide (TPR) repeat protein
MSDHEDREDGFEQWLVRASDHPCHEFAVDAFALVTSPPEDPSAARHAAFELVAELRSGELRRALERGSVERLDWATAVDDGTSEAVAHAWTVRALLDVVRLPDEDGQAELEVELFELDRELDPFGIALICVESWRGRRVLDAFERLAPGHIIDEAWWGLLARVDDGKSDRELDADIARVASESARVAISEPSSHAHEPIRMRLRAAASSDDLIARIRRLAMPAGPKRTRLLHQIEGELMDTPCVWLHANLLREIDALPDPELAAKLRQQVATRKLGCAPVLLALEHGLESGCVAELRIDHRDPNSDEPTFDTLLRRQSIAAIYDAYRAAGSLTRTGLPPKPLEQHTIELVVPPSLDIVEIDGASLGLSAALAFLSHWSGKELDDRVVPAAAVQTSQSSSSWGLAHVGHVAAKVAALVDIRTAATEPVTLITDGQDVPLARERASDRVLVRGAKTLVEVVNFAGLDPLAIESSWGNGRALRNALQAAMDAVTYQDIEGTGPEPWMLLGDRIHTLVELLGAKQAMAADLLPNARALGALAFTHAGQPHLGLQLLRPLLGDGEAELPPVSRATVMTCQLAMLIDNLDRDEAQAEQLCERLLSLVGSEIEALQLVRGQALGTIGRYWLHRREAERALPYLQQAIVEHERSLPGDVGRSRIYLVKALRTLGRLHEARDELGRAATDIKNKTVAYTDHSYAEACRMFWHYEHARLLLALEDTESAEHAGYCALRHAEATGSWWPALGIRRLMVWIACAASNQQQRDRHLEALAALRESAPASWFARFQRDAELGWDHPLAEIY